MKGSNYTIQQLEMHNQLTQEQNRNNELALQLKKTAQELLAAKRVVRAYERAKQLVIDAHPNTLPDWDQALSQALREMHEAMEA